MDDLPMTTVICEPNVSSSLINPHGEKIEFPKMSEREKINATSSVTGQLILNFYMSFWCLQISKRTNEIFVRISVLASKKGSNKKK